MENAIPVNHSFGDVGGFINPPNDSNRQDMAISDLAAQPGWEILEKSIKAEIERLGSIQMQEGETFEQFGLRVFAAQLAKGRLEWVVGHVRRTADAVAGQQ